MDRLRITVDRDACCGMGRCATTEPELFDQDPTTGTVVLLDPTPPPELHDTARLCAELCPCGAIEVAEETEPSGTAEDTGTGT